MKEAFFFDFLGVKTQSEVVSRFLETLMDTNRDHRFFVDWAKVRKNAQDLKVELSILNALVGSRNFDQELASILEKYPEVLAAVPILLALRDPQLSVILDFQSPGLEVVDYDFSPRKLSERDIRNIVNFFVQTGLRDFFLQLASRCLLDLSLIHI